LHSVLLIMWAVLNPINNKSILSVLPPDTPKDKVQEISKTHTLILVTPQTGVGYIPGYYENGKFYKGRIQK